MPSVVAITPKVEKLLRAAWTNPNMTLKEIADMLGLHNRSTVTLRAKRLGLPNRDTRRKPPLAPDPGFQPFVDPPRPTSIVQLWDDGWMIKPITKQQRMAGSARVRSWVK